MKCNNCNQELIDNKEYCPNCGKKLRETNTTFSNKTMIIVGLLLIFIGTVTVLSIMYFGTEKELDKYIKDNEQKETNNDIDINISKYYGSYKITNVVTTNNTKEEIKSSLEYLTDWNVDFSKEKLKFGLDRIEWIYIEKPSIYIMKDNMNLDLILGSEVDSMLSIEGKNSLFSEDENKTIYLIESNEKLYLYYRNTFFEISKSTDNYKDNMTFYKKNIIKEEYTVEINNMIKSIDDEITKLIESDEILIVYVEQEVIEYDNIKHIVFNISRGVPNAGGFSTYKTITYNTKTLKMYNLEEYISYIGKSYDDIVTKYENKKSTLKEVESRDIPITEDIVYYVSNNILYIPYEIGDFGYKFVEIDLAG